MLSGVLAGDKVVIVLGARQVGKTTLVEHVLAGRKALLLNFDVEIDKRRFLAAAALSPEEGLKSLGSPEVLVVDEAQRLPESARIVKGWHDARLPVKILLLGSSSLNLLDQAAESLTGRNEKLRLPPLVFEEALRAQDWYSDSYTPRILREQFAAPLRVSLLQSLAFGAYPEVVLAERQAARSAPFEFGLSLEGHPPDRSCEVARPDQTAADPAGASGGQRGLHSRTGDATPDGPTHR